MAPTLVAPWSCPHSLVVASNRQYYSYRRASDRLCIWRKVIDQCRITCTGEYSVLPTSCEYSVLPTSCEYSVLPTSCEYSVLPTSCEYSVLPTSSKYSVLPTTHRQSWLFSADFGPILGCFGLFKTDSWLSPADTSSYRHSLSVSQGSFTIFTPSSLFTTTAFLPAWSAAFCSEVSFSQHSVWRWTQGQSSLPTHMCPRHLCSLTLLALL